MKNDTGGLPGRPANMEETLSTTEQLEKPEAPTAAPAAQANPAEATPKAARPAAAHAIMRIQPSHGWVSLKLEELWSYRELLFFMVWRDVKVRYKQTALGAAWAIIQPLFTMLVFSLFLGKLGKMASDGVPYPLFNFAALVPWTYFASSLSHSSDSLVGSANLIRKVYFPRLVIPLATILAGGVDFLIAFGMLGLMMVYFGVTPTVNVIYLPLLIVLGVTTALGVGLWLSSLNVKFRDVKYTVPFLIQFWMFATPIVYPSSLLPEKWRLVYALNPMAGVVEGFRWALLGTKTAPGPMILVSATAAVALLVSGAYYFRRMEKTFADTV
ncbi:MAG: ABC transporter permease [Bryobacteraceae bacterium]